LFIDGQVLIVDIAHSISLLTSSPDPTGETKTHQKIEIAFKHGIDAQAIMMT
jgi:hypothetical protein